MTAAQEMKRLLFEELQLIVRTTTGLISKIKPEDLSFRPRENMRTVKELADHLAAIPAVDLLILQERPESDIRQLEGQFAEAAPSALGPLMEQGLDELKRYMEALSEQDFWHKETKPFYMDHGSSQAKWLVEIVTHAQHHRGQLFTYLKMQGYEVNMFDLY
ncbi:damage-inducible protein DinB [Paenibacillus yonginensis]|uniref:Damage-inducible protein DinB n=1 Tax=Paenibacillus yonginensis TaxID=1462996 RepID=A0A1B1N022_9BACL|nr:DinB family protein [Paenibacillus yonginensis]ANS74756.1 damage-inducible protein DinB [Paenibacillus yonginensis]